MTLINRTKYDIEQVHITRCNDRTDSVRRNDETILAGGKYTFRLSPGCWIMRVGNRSARHSFGVMAEQDFVLDYSGK